MRTLLAGILTVLLNLFAAQSSIAQTPADTAQPVIVYIETNPWLMVIGSDSPQFALYADGTVIFRTSEGYRRSKLDDEQRAEIEGAIELNGLEPYTEYLTASDQPSSIIYDFREKRAVWAYGAVSRWRNAPSGDDPLLRMIKVLREFRVTDAEPWIPDFIEVMIWPYEYAPEESIVWQRDWPGINDARTVRRGNSFSIFFPSAHSEELFAFLGTRRERGAVEIDGQKWAVSLRYPFPGEEQWSQPSASD
ncbi:hypothetical protein MACH24_20440 [Erythrobacter sp. Dej080120_24]|uniref:hypothetical protein n=1 Tax=Erythrobacter sp. Dej080120_24 TaxID=3024837 RepID=UPI002923AA0F|nr:hypothetical protein MACH24_20440 [Erythrobacter sp. Dej080120_24]